MLNTLQLRSTVPERKLILKLEQHLLFHPVGRKQWCLIKKYKDMQGSDSTEEMKMDLTKNPTWNKAVHMQLQREGKVCVEKAVIRAKFNVLETPALLPSLASHIESRRQLERDYEMKKYIYVEGHKHNQVYRIIFLKAGFSI